MNRFTYNRDGSIDYIPEGEPRPADYWFKVTLEGRKRHLREGIVADRARAAEGGSLGWLYESCADQAEITLASLCEEG